MTKSIYNAEHLPGEDVTPLPIKHFALSIDDSIHDDEVFEGSVVNDVSPVKKKARSDGRQMQFFPNENDIIVEEDVFWYSSFRCPCGEVLTVFSAYHHYLGTKCTSFNLPDKLVDIKNNIAKQIENSKQRKKESMEGIDELELKKI